MPPKPKKQDEPKKKLTRKEKALEKKQEKERNKEIDRRMEQERLQKDVIEVAKAADAARIAKEEYEAWLKAEEDRLHAEKVSLGDFWTWRKGELIRLEREKNNAREWKQYLEGTRLPDVSHAPAVNSYLDVMHGSFDIDFQALIQTLIDIFTVSKCSMDLALTEEQKGDSLQIEKYRGYMVQLEELAGWHLDQTTAFLLHTSYETWRDRSENIFCAEAEGWKLALWVNHAKNPRFRVLELPAISVVLNLPKSFALANVAIRLQHRMTDPVARSRNSYMSMGGTFVIDVLVMPPPSNIVNGWTLDSVSSSLSSVVKIDYPIPVIGAPIPTGAAVLPIGVVLFLPDYIIHLNSPEVGWWDEEKESWQTEGITDIVYEGEERKLSFQTTKTMMFSVIYNRVKQFPYISWNIRPTSECGALMTLITNLFVFKIEIGSGWCKLLEPSFPECESFAANPLPPRVMLQNFSRCGLHLLPANDDASYINATVKDADLELSTCIDMALAAPVFTIASSRRNSSAGNDVCIVRFLEIPEPQFPCSLDKSKAVKTLIYKIKGCAILDSDENEKYNIREYTGTELTEYHTSLLVTLHAYYSNDTMKKVQTGFPAFTECVKDLAYALRLFSFGA